MEYTRVTYFNVGWNYKYGTPGREEVLVLYFKGNPSYEEIGKAIMASKRNDKFAISKALIKCKYSFPIGHWRPQGWDHDCKMWIHTDNGGSEGFELEPFNLV